MGFNAIKLFNKTVSQRIILLSIFVLFSIAASIQSLTLGTKKYHEGGIEYNHYNNYTIFEKSFFHLINGQDLYILYPDEHWDLYKYTPTFAVFFGALAILPDWTGLTLWNLINAIILLLAIYYLPKFTDREKGIILLIVLIELMTSMQNEQSNGLIAGLLVFTFGFLEKEKYAAATFCVVFSCFIKLFGIVGMALFLFYPKKWKLAIYSVGWTIFLFAVPLIFVDTAQYQNLLQSYGKLLTNDHNASLGYSVMGWLHSWFNVSVDKLSMVLVGVVIFMAPISKLQNFKLQPFRLLTLTSILIWIVIFNHKAESPTFILAMTGVAIWFVWSEKNIINITLFILAFIFTSLSPTDIFPKYIRDELVKPYTLKAVPCILIWIKIIYDMFLLKPSRQEVILDQKDR